jgi:HD superfamily phosphohydrolase
MITLSRAELRIVDTDEFQRLRDLRQLSVTHYVFPFAMHTRLAHSMQVCHWTGWFLERLQRNQPELQVAPRTVELVRVAALIHDIGHTCFSHTFDDHVAPAIGLRWPHHEQRSEALFRYMVRRYALDYTPDEVDLICQLLKGGDAPPFDPPADQSKPPAPQGGEGVAARPPWLFQIVANHAFEFDMDKLCYLVTDAQQAGLPLDLQVERILDNARVINDRICFHVKVAELIVDVFRARAKMHRDVYRHHTIVAIDRMVSDMLLLMARLDGWAALFNDDEHAWARTLDDTVLRGIPERKPRCEADAADEKRLSELYYRLRYRHLYKAERLQSSGGGQPVTSKEGDIFECSAGFASGQGNPLRHVMCYNDRGDVVPLLDCDLSTVGPNVPRHRLRFRITGGAPQ